MSGLGALSDVPTIVPIVLALVLFFSTVVWAINRVNSVNDDIQLSLTAIKVAETFTQTAYLTSTVWNQFCTAARTQFSNVPFIVRVVPFDKYESSSGSIGVLLRAFGSYVCTDRQNPSASIQSARKVLVNAFPVLVQTQTSPPRNKLYVLVVGVWEEA